jgi:hypothetical protein
MLTKLKLAHLRDGGMRLFKCCQGRQPSEEGIVTGIDNAQPIDVSSKRYLHKQAGCLIGTPSDKNPSVSNGLLRTEKAVLLWE